MLNGGAINGFAINGAVSDPVVRVRIDSTLRAHVIPSPRVFGHLAVHIEPTATVGGLVGRVHSRQRLERAAQAEVTGALGVVLRRAPVQAEAKTAASIAVGFTRDHIHVSGQAGVQATARVFRRERIQTTPRADAGVVGRVFVRAPMGVEPAAFAVAGGFVIPRRNISVPLVLFPTAGASVAGRVVGRLSVFAESRATINAHHMVFARHSGATTASAQIAVGGSAVRVAKWDEPAPDERRFQVAPGAFTFVVMD